MSDISNEEIKEILDSIREKAENIDIDGDDVRNWSRDDIDRLLRVTRREHEERASVYLTEDEDVPVEATAKKSIYETEAEETLEPEKASEATRVFEKVEEPLRQTNENDKTAKSIEDIMNGEVEEKTTPKKLFGSLKQKVSSMAENLKKLSEKSAEKQDDNAEYDEYDDDFEPDDGLGNADEDEDIKIADFHEKEKPENDVQENDGKTILIEKPGIVIKKGESGENTELEGAPIIMSADDALANDEKAKIPTIERMQNDLRSKLREAQEDGQIILSGFESAADEKPETIDEDKAEQELFEKRKKKIDNFVLFGDDDDPYGSDSEKEKLGELFDTHDDRPRHKETKKFDGVEYEQTKDARRVQKYLNLQKKKSLQKLVTLSVMSVLSVITGFLASIKTTVGGDRFMTIFFSLILITVSVIISSQSIIESAERLKKKQINLNTLIYFSALLCFVQTVVMLFSYFFGGNPVSVFSCAGVVLLFLSEYNNYTIACRTYDAMSFCTGGNKDKLYSVESISDDKDVLELGKYTYGKAARIRYSCKTRFPSHLIEMCTSETDMDKRARLMFMIISIMSAINFIVAGIVGKSPEVGFSAFVITFALCAPAYASLLIQLPLRWTNKVINRKGALISSQEAVNEICRTNVIVVDSRDLFDRDGCEMLGFKDFKNVRVDDAMLYAAAMVIRSGGPLIGVFDKMLVNRRDLLPTVKSFSYEEKMGVSGWIYNQKVILGNRAMMTNHNVEIPRDVDEDKYLVKGYEVMYLAIAHKLAAMIVVSYAPDRNIADHLKKLRDSGVSVLVRNCDPNVTERMISICYDMRLDNIKIISSASGRVFKKYKAKPKVATRAVCIHDGSTYTFADSLCTAANLRHSFKVARLMTYIGIGAGFAIVFLLSWLNVIADLPAIFILIMQGIMAGGFIGVARLTGGK